MSRGNVEIARRMYDAYAQGDFDATFSCLDPEIEFSQPVGEPGAGIYHGHAGVRQAMTRWAGAWDDYRVQIEGLVDLGEHVLARTRHHGRGKSSGLEVELQIFQLLTLRDNRIVRMRMYYDEAEALAAVGPRE